MRDHALIPALCVAGLLVVVGCSPSTPDEAGTASSDNDPPISAEPLEGFPATTPAISPPGPSGGEVPLTPGVYVVEGEDCRSPANAGWRVWDGDGLSGSSTRACRATIISRSGDDYTLRNSCENTYDGTRTDETLVMTVRDQVHFSVKGQAFESCPMAKVPGYLRELVTGPVTADTTLNSENYARVMEARSREYDRLEYKPVTLNGFECGDNCYLEVTEAVEGAAPRKVLCTARLCGDWQGEGRLPASLRNTGATAKFGRADQVDGAGTVMAADVETVVDLRLRPSR